MIEVTGLHKSFCSGRGRVEAVRDVSFRVERGKSLVVAGKSGSGKTTLLACLGGLEQPDSGSIVCKDVEISTLSRKALSLFQRRHLGFVFQFGNLISYLTVFENIAFPLVLNGVSRIQRHRRVEWLLERIALGEARDALPHELSGGELQRVAFARAIAHNPSILLADEPTSSLDSKSAGDIMELMFSLARESLRTIVVVTHDPDLMAWGDEAIVLKDGLRQNARPDL
jgi:putative ABC transport system ATP-binding protein